MATIKDVARLAQVSISTVSHVLNGTRFVSEDTKEKVNSAVEALGYKPSALARGLKTNKTHSIGMLTGSNANPFFAEVIHGVEACCYERGYHLVLCNSEDDLEKQASYLKTLEEKQVDGMMIMSSHSDPAFFDLLRRKQEQKDYCPMVILDSHPSGLNADIITEDPINGAYQATRHLISKGHKDIACICGPFTYSPSSERLEGFKMAMHEANLSTPEQWFIEGELTAKSGYDAVVNLLRQSKHPSALFVGNDLMAIGAICALQTKGLKVPEDVSVIGYDNIDLSAYTSPPLTTINQPKAELGRLAANTLIDRIENKVKTTTVKVLKSELIERKSIKDISS